MVLRLRRLAFREQDAHDHEIGDASNEQNNRPELGRGNIPDELSAMVIAPEFHDEAPNPIRDHVNPEIENAFFFDMPNEARTEQTPLILQYSCPQTFDISGMPVKSVMPQIMPYVTGETGRRNISPTFVLESRYSPQRESFIRNLSRSL